VLIRSYAPTAGLFPDEAVGASPPARAGDFLHFREKVEGRGSMKAANWGDRN
jgi:hypothetical protein